MKTNLLLALSWLLVGWGSLQAQSYKILQNDPSVNFYTVCDSADAYFKDRFQGKGSGYKPYLRWKHEQESKFYPSGDRQVDIFMPYKEYERIKREEQSKPRTKLFQTGGWHSLGPDTIQLVTGHYAAGLGRVEYVEVNRNNPQQIYIGSRSGGLWRTSNDGGNWKHNTDFLPASGVNAIAASPTYFDSVLINVRNAGNGTSFGIYRSVDGGDNFVPTNFRPTALGGSLAFGGLGSNFQVHVIKYHPRVANLVFIGTDRGIFKSTDNLATWVRTNTSWNVVDIAFHPTDDNIIYLHENYYWGSNRNKIMKSTDQGNSYLALADLAGNGSAKIKISTSPLCPNCVFAGSDNGIWKSTDAGATFITVQNPAPAGVSLYMATPNDNDTSQWVSGYLDLYRSSNNGATFAQCSWWSLGATQHGGSNNQTAFNNSSKYVHADNNYLTCINGVFYSCSDGFLSKSADNGQNWTKLSRRVGIRENYNLGVSQSNHYRTICGSQDNGTSIITENGWNEFYGADGMEALIHPLNDNWMLGSTQNGGRRRTRDGGFNQDGISPAAQTNASWIAPMFYDPNDHFTIYSLGEALHKSVDFGNTWVTLGSPSSFTGGIQYATIAENNSNLIVVTKNEFIDLSRDGGLTFSSIKTPTLPNNWITDVVFAPNNDSILVLSYDSYQNNGQKVFISYNLGASWQNITYNLGSMPIKSVIIDHTDSSNIYLGATVGIYTKTLNGNSWQLYNNNLPNVSTNELEINYGSNTIRAATWGRGLWEYSLVGRNSYPSILKTSITDQPTLETPKTGVPQFVSSQIDYNGSLSSVFVCWAVGSANFNLSNSINMSSTGGNNWRSVSPLPDFPAGTKVFFKVFAVGSAADTSETYKFMYELKPYVYCAASGESANGNLYISRFSCANLVNNSLNTAYTSYNSNFINLYQDSSYTATGNFNTGWASNDFIVWIDYDNDAVFEANERVVFDPNTSNLGTGTFTVPNTTVEDTVKMRVRLGYWGNGGNSDDPCGTTLGEVEDYLVILRKNQPLVLPLDLLYFNGWRQSKTNLLSWATRHEPDYDYFILQRSQNGVDFSNLADIDAQNSPQTAHNYQFEDQNPAIGINYYRLELLKTDGSSHYSNIIALSSEEQQGYSFYPNPSNGQVYYQFESAGVENLQITVYDPAGKEVQRKAYTSALGNNSLSVDLSNQPAGVYLIRAEHRDGSRQAKIIKK